MFSSQKNPTYPTLAMKHLSYLGHENALTKKLVRFYRELAVSDNFLVLFYWYITVLLPRVVPLNTIKQH